jgi:hypothetical protein
VEASRNIHYRAYLAVEIFGNLTRLTAHPSYFLVIYLASGSTTFDGAAKNRNGLDEKDDTIDAVKKPLGDEVDNIKVVEVEKETEEKKDDKEAKDETTDAVKAETTEKFEKDHYYLLSLALHNNAAVIKDAKGHTNIDCNENKFVGIVISTGHCN